jgi:hypothetical protein
MQFMQDSSQVLTDVFRLAPLPITFKARDPDIMDFSAIGKVNYQLKLRTEEGTSGIITRRETSCSEKCLNIREYSWSESIFARTAINCVAPTRFSFGTFRMKQVTPYSSRTVFVLVLGRREMRAEPSHLYDIVPASFCEAILDQTLCTAALRPRIEVFPRRSEERLQKPCFIMGGIDLPAVLH